MIPLAVLLALYDRDDPVLFERALCSVLNQDLPENHVVRVYLGVDGPINSDLDDVVKRYSGNLHHISRSECNEGLAATLNRLIAVLDREEFVFRMDADDYSLPGRFRMQLDYLHDNPGVDIVGTDIIEWDRSSDHRRRVVYANDHEDAVRKMPRRVPVAHPTVCFRRSVFGVIPQYPCVVGNEDVAMWFSCIKSNLRFGNVHLPLLIFTVSENFWARRSFSKALSEFLCYVRGIWSLNGVTWLYLFPVARLLVRLSPRLISKCFYNSAFRRG